MTIEYSSTVTLDEVLIEHNTVLGSGSFDKGGAIANHGKLRISNSTITDNNACSGGGIESEYVWLYITDTTISYNTARNETSCGLGGGLYLYGMDDVELSRIVLEHNSAKYGGGLYYDGTPGITMQDITIRENDAQSGGGLYNMGTVILTSSTVSGNQASSLGGGIINFKSLSLTNVTINDNEAAHGGGLHNYSFSDTNMSMEHCTVSSNVGTISGYALKTTGVTQTTIHNTILTSYAYGETCALDPAGTLTDLGHNLSYDSSCGLSDPHSQISVSPALQPLGDNGGPTWTMAPSWGSPVVDGGDPDSFQTRDQRGYYRPVNGDQSLGDPYPGAVADIGAFEYGSFELTLFSWLPLLMK